MGVEGLTLLQYSVDGRYGHVGIRVCRGDGTTHDFCRYTYTYLGTVASYLSDTCNAANGYAEGRCIFDGREDAIWVGNTAVSTQST